MSTYKLISVIGDNIVASEGEDWKRHRKIAQPAFSEVSNAPLSHTNYLTSPSISEKKQTCLGGDVSNR